MKITSLAATPMQYIVACFNEAFADYVIPVKVDQAYLRNRWIAARVDYDLSFGVFEEDRLVGFVIHGIDRWHGSCTAFNAATGIIPEYRGNHLVGTIYEKARTQMEKAGVTRLMLEVIVSNSRAVRVYEHAGFTVTRKLHCFSGAVAGIPGAKHGIAITEADRPDWNAYSRLLPAAPSWENSREAVGMASSSFRFLEVRDDKALRAFAVVHPGNDQIFQCGWSSGAEQELTALLMSFGLSRSSVKITNVDENAVALRDLLARAGLKETAVQYEMERPL